VAGQDGKMYVFETASEIAYGCVYFRMVSAYADWCNAVMTISLCSLQFAHLKSEVLLVHKYPEITVHVPVSKYLN
jgi:hypothetical protein